MLMALVHLKHKLMYSCVLTYTVFWRWWPSTCKPDLYDLKDFSTTRITIVTLPEHVDMCFAGNDV